MDLKDIVAKWLKEEFPNWEIGGSIPQGNEVLHFIRFKPLHREQVWLFSDRIEFDDDGRWGFNNRLVIMAHDTRFFELLWNRLHSMESGFQKAIASRDSNRPKG